MARAKTGGTRSLLKGVVGDVLYQIARNPLVDNRQLVYNYTGERINNNTALQALARMQIAMFQRIMQYLSDVFYCSWEGLPYGLQSINYFVKTNMDLVQNDSRNNWNSYAGFFYPEKGKEAAAAGTFVVSAGSYIVPPQWTVQCAGGSKYYRQFRLRPVGTGRRKIDYRRALGFSNDDSINIIMCLSIGYQQNVFYRSYHIQFNPAMNDYEEVTPQSMFRLFRGIDLKDISLGYDRETGEVIFYMYCLLPPPNQQFTAEQIFHAVIFSRKRGRTWQRNTEYFHPPFDLTEQDEWGRFPADVFKTWWPDFEDQTYKELFGNR